MCGPWGDFIFSSVMLLVEVIEDEDKEGEEEKLEEEEEVEVANTEEIVG